MSKGEVMKTTNILVIGVLVLCPSFVSATSIFFGINAPTTGTISYAGGGASLIGAGIEVDSITGIDTPLNAGVPILCSSCILEFTSGTSISDWVFGSGSISITGGATEPGIPDNSILLDGIFSSINVVDSGGGFFDVAINLEDLFIDDKHEALCSYYEAPCGNFEGELHMNFTVLGAPDVGDGFSSNAVLDGGALNVVVLIPVPASVYLLGSALGLLGWMRRKKA